jgi:acetylornithine/succinyldiaminopimelate/putrescine aminotransferase
MPDELKNLAVIARYNDLEAARQVMRTHGNEVAGIILEPIAMNMGVIIPISSSSKGCGSWRTNIAAFLSSTRSRPPESFTVGPMSGVV